MGGRYISIHSLQAIYEIKDVAYLLKAVHKSQSRVVRLSVCMSIHFRMLFKTTLVMNEHL